MTRVTNTLAILVATPCLMLAALAGVVLAASSAAFDQLVNIWKKS